MRSEKTNKHSYNVICAVNNPDLSDLAEESVWNMEAGLGSVVWPCASIIPSEISKETNILIALPEDSILMVRLATGQIQNYFHLPPGLAIDLPETDSEIIWPRCFNFLAHLCLWQEYHYEW
jgi:hypothetical protein